MREAAVAAEEEIEWDARPASAIGSVGKIGDVGIAEVENAFDAGAAARAAGGARSDFGMAFDGKHRH